MTNNPLESSISENKNLIEEFRQEAQKLIDETFMQVKERYRQLVDMGHSYGLDDDSIDWILQDLLGNRINKRTLYNYRREYLQLENLSEIADKKVIEQSLETATPVLDITTTEDQEEPEPAIVIPPREEIIEDAEIVEEDEDFFIPPNRFRKVLMDLMKVRQTGEVTGVRITKDWKVITD